jgi:hypothetical protein
MSGGATSLQFLDEAIYDVERARQGATQQRHELRLGSFGPSLDLGSYERVFTSTTHANVGRDRRKLNRRSLGASASELIL